MKIEYPIIIKDVLPNSTFFSLRDEFKHVGWGLYNYSKNADRENERISWKLNQYNNTLIMYQCASIIKLKLQKYLKQDLIFIRAHSNGATFGQTCRFHVDFNEDDIWTFVLFTEKNWNTQWGGEFITLDPDNQEYKYTPYIPNSGALVPSNWEHYGAAPNDTTDKLRTTVAFSYSSKQSFDSVKNNSIVKSFL
tara:strand:- start:33 stop:611 length:579 start_codon:yes stop_codon:yes gene_type:complete